MKLKRAHSGIAVVMSFALAAAAIPGSAAETKATKEQLARGKYLLIVGSCNDCHTAGFAPSDGKVPESQWLLGDGQLGFRGPWGTTYATNLRLSLSRMTEDQWVHYARNLRMRPPMPWFNLNQWTEQDLRAFYQYVRQLGPAGKAVTVGLPPEKAPPPPYIQWPAPPKK
jgi:mono/diheme cytochrome c family protein